MKTLEISLRGFPNKIVIGSMTKEEKSKIEEYCLLNLVFLEKEDLFTGEVMLFDEKLKWYERGNHYHNNGLVFSDKKDINESLKDLKITLDGKKISFDPTKIKVEIYDPEEIPKVDKNEVVFSYGSKNKGTMTWEKEIEEEFDENKLTFSFDDLRNFDFDCLLLTHVEYKGDQIYQEENSRGKGMYDVTFY
jgi:hypothetical protein